MRGWTCEAPMGGLTASRKHDKLHLVGSSVLVRMNDARGAGEMALLFYFVMYGLTQRNE